MTEQLVKWIEDLPALGECDAAELADAIVDAAADVLRRDPALPPRSLLEWELALAKVHAFAVERINARILDHVDRLDALNAAEWESSTDGPREQR